MLLESAPETGLFGGDRGKWEAGYIAGAGLEYKFNQQWSVRGEYRFVQFHINRNSSFISNTNAIATTSTLLHTALYQNVGTNFNFNQGMVGVFYQFA